MKEVIIDISLLSFLVEFGYTEIITTTNEGFTCGELIQVYEIDKPKKITAQITNAHYIQKRKSGLLLYHLSISYVV